MRQIALKDLSERIVPIGAVMTEDQATGGWVQTDTQLSEVWAMIAPIVGSDGYHPDDLGGGMAGQKGYIKKRPTTRYRVVVRSFVDLTGVVEIEWIQAGQNRRLILSEEPYQVQGGKYKCVRVVENHES